MQSLLSIGEAHSLPRDFTRPMLESVEFYTAEELRNEFPDPIVVDSLRNILGASLGVVGCTAFLVGEELGSAVQKAMLNKVGGVTLTMPTDADGGERRAIAGQPRGALTPSQVQFREGQNADEVKACALCVFYPTEVKKQRGGRLAFVRRLGAWNFFAVADDANGKFVAKFIGRGNAHVVYSLVAFRI